MVFIGGGMANVGGRDFSFNDPKLNMPVF